MCKLQVARATAAPHGDASEQLKYFYLLQRFDDYSQTEQKLWNDTCESNLEYLRTLYAKEKYEKALREKVRATRSVFPWCV